MKSYYISSMETSRELFSMSLFSSWLISPEVNAKKDGVLTFIYLNVQ